MPDAARYQRIKTRQHLLDRCNICSAARRPGRLLCQACADKRNADNIRYAAKRWAFCACGAATPTAWSKLCNRCRRRAWLEGRPRAFYNRLFYDPVTRTVQYTSPRHSVVYRVIDIASRDEASLPDFHELPEVDVATECATLAPDDDVRASTVRSGGGQYRFREEW